MIVAPNDDTGNVDWPPRWMGTIVVPDDPFPSPAAEPIDDPVARAEAQRARAGRAFDLVGAATDATRSLDELATTIDDENDWRNGVSRFDRGVAELRRRHGESFDDPGDRSAFDDHLDRFAALRRMDLRQGLVDSQHAAAFGRLEETLAYYAERAAQAKYPIEHDMFSDAGMEAIERLREAGYMGPQLAGLFHEDFRKQIEEPGRPKSNPAPRGQSPETEDATQGGTDHALIRDANDLAGLIKVAAGEGRDNPTPIIQLFLRKFVERLERSRQQSPGEKMPGAVPPEAPARGAPASEPAPRYETGAFAHGQLRSADEIGEFVKRHVQGVPKGQIVPNPTFEIGKLDNSATEILRKHAPGFSEVPSQLFVSGRSLKHTDEQRPDFFNKYLERLPEIVRNPDQVLPNPTQPSDPWKRPWLLKQLDKDVAALVEVRANGNGIDVVNFIAPVDRSRINRALQQAEKLQINPRDLSVSK